MKNKKYYIAYGSNLSVEQMAYRCPDAKIAGQAVLAGWELLFRGCATIAPNPKKNTPVLVWEISERDEGNLDLYEGYPNYYRKEDLNIELLREEAEPEMVTAMVYIMENDFGRRSPSRYYYKVLHDGYKAFHFPMHILEGALKMAIFLGYMFLCTRFKDLHRVFEYHGAEHKTIACYEAGLPLTVENIRRQSRFHPRCGTSFMILVIIISIFLYAVLPWTSTGMRIVYKLCMFPLLVGISYEILKWAGRSDSVLSKIVSQPGLWMQRLTTFEPDDSMIEVAIAAVTPVLPEKQEEARW